MCDYSVEIINLAWSETEYSVAIILPFQERVFASIGQTKRGIV